MHPFSTIYPCLGHEGGSLSKEDQTFLTLATSSSSLILLYCLSIFKKGAQQRIQNCFWACVKNAWAITKKQAWSTSCIPGKSKKVVKWLKEMVTQPEILDLRASVSKYLLCCQYISLNLFQLSNNTCRNFLCYNERTTDTMSAFMHDGVVQLHHMC